MTVVLDIEAFELTPSEAFQIGFCLGEFERRGNLVRETGTFHFPSIRFFDILVSRLLPHSPSQQKWKADQFAIGAVPGDVEWRTLSISTSHALARSFANEEVPAIGEGNYFGCAPSTPGIVYTISKGGVFAWESVASGRSFFDHVLATVKDHLRLDSGEEFLVLQSFTRNRSVRPMNSTGFKVETDAWDEICKLLRGLIKSDQLSEFELGTQFGTLIAEFEFFELWIADMKDNIQIGNPCVEGERHRCSVTQLADSLSKHEIVLKCHFAESKLATISDVQCVLNGEYEDAYQPLFDANAMIAETAFEQVRTHKESAWLSIGDVLGTIRSREQSDDESIAKKSLARLADIFRTESVDRVIIDVNKVQSDLQKDPAMPAWAIVKALAPQVETIAKRLWPNDFRNNDRLGSVLSSKLQLDRRSKEYRIANIAISLVNYRNQVLHDLDGFKCTSDEAQFVLFGVRALVRIWKEIEDAKSPGK